MIIKQLTLTNFRVFKDTHTINLEPEADKHIILFGGLNGAGKTSILTGIRFALLGRAAIENSNTNAVYIQNLGDLVHGGNTELEAKVTLVFEYHSDGKTTLYTVERRWKIGSSDKLTILENGQDIGSDYEKSQSFLLELVPPGIADLVFFDGEKIADLAEDTSGSILKQAVKRLLGLDTIGRLKEDLSIYLKRIGIEAAGEKVKKVIESLEIEKQTCLEESDEIRKLADTESNKIVELNEKIKIAEQDVLTGGGAWAKDKEAEKAKVEELLKLKAEQENHILRELDGSYALSLAPKTMALLLENMKKESEVNAKKSFESEFAKLIPTLTDKLADQAGLIEVIKQEVSDHATAYEALEVEFGLSIQQNAMLSQQISEQSPQSQTNVAQLKKDLNKTLNSIDYASVNIARAPEQEQLKKSFEKLQSLQKQKQTYVQNYRKHLEAVKVLLSKAHQLASRLSKMQGDMNKAFGNNDGALRATSTIALLNEFSTHLIQARLSELEHEFIASYKRLARKEDLDITAQIDQQTFDVALIDSDGHSVNRSSLSAGEKQIYAISMLDALARVSGRKLPVVIDTPLGRLDSHHRDKLVENYFPHAAEQVIILSTDTEIDEAFFKGMENNLAHSYEISFNPATRSSTISEGYFWHRNSTMEAV